MKSLRGGLLARKNPNMEAVFNKAGQKRTPAEWALRFGWNHPGFQISLMGMFAGADGRKPS